MIKIALSAGFFCTALLSVPAVAAPAKQHPPKPPVHRVQHAQPGTLGTHQMAGGEGVFGETYTVSDGGRYGPMNFTLTSAEYTAERLPFSPDFAAIPKVGEKLLVLHYRVKNPNTSDFYFRPSLLFQTVAADGLTRSDIEQSRRLTQKITVGDTLKPGQGYDDVVTCAVVPASGGTPKIILQYGRVGTADKVIRYTLGTSKNPVKAIPAPYADPADPTGGTALTEIPAKIGIPYIAGVYDLTLLSAAYAPGPFGETTAEDGKQFLVVTVSVANKTWAQNYFKDTLSPVLLTSDDEKTTTCSLFKGKRNEPWEGQQIEAGETATVRLLFQITKDTTAKTLKLSEAVDNSGGTSHALVYDLSGVK